MKFFAVEVLEHVNHQFVVGVEDDQDADYAMVVAKRIVTDLPPRTIIAMNVAEATSETILVDPIIATPREGMTAFEFNSLAAELIVGDGT